MSFEKSWVWRQRFVFIESFCASSACQNSNASDIIGDFSVVESLSSKRLSTETLMKELKHVFMEKSKFQHSAKSKFDIIYIWELFGKRIFFVKKPINL